MGIGIILRDINRLPGMLREDCVQQFGNFTTTFVRAKERNGFPRMIVHGTQTIAFRWLSRRGNHDLLSARTPQRAQRWKPAEIKFVGVIKNLANVQMITRFLDRLFFSSYSGSGLVILCCGRLITMSFCFKSRRRVSSENRRPVWSAR